MQDLQLPPTINVPSVQFASNQEFYKRSITHEGDVAFARYKIKPWMRALKNDPRNNREVIATLLAAQGANSADCVEKLLAEEIAYHDLGALTHADLELMGFKQRKEREELLSFFGQLPNQEPSYQDICKSADAKLYNLEILNNAIAHMDSMRSALAAANYKLKIMPPEDVIVGEKSFASRFVLEALTELKGATDDIDKQLDEVEEIVNADLNIKKGPRKSRKAKPKTPFNVGGIIIITAVATGALAALWLWRVNKLEYK